MRDSTRLPYPRSFLGLLLTGFTLVMLPLVGSLAYSAWNTEHLAGQSRTAVFNASQAARVSRSLVDRIGSVERLAQQIALLDDPELGADYARVHHSFRQLADEIAQLPLDATQSAALASTVAQEQSLYGRLTESPRAQLAAGEITEHVERLSDTPREVPPISNRPAAPEAERLRSTASPAAALGCS